MRAVKECVALFALFILSDSVCFIEEQSATVVKAYRVLINVESYRRCQIYCEDDPKCVIVTYSDTKRICHLQVPNYYSTCNPVPYRRYVKTEQNCVGSPGNHPSSYPRIDRIRDHGSDPCFPDPSFLHPELVNDAIISAPPCPVRKLDGSQGPVLHFRRVSLSLELAISLSGKAFGLTSNRNIQPHYSRKGLDGNGTYASYGNSKDVRVYFSTISNAWILQYDKDIPDPATFNPNWFVSVTCAEEGDQCPCGPLPLHPTIVGTRPTINGIGACPTPLRLHTKPVRWTTDYVVDGATARLFCAAGSWMAGTNDPATFMLVYSGVCAA